ncbi:MAG TPA: hypothetical protein GXX17_06475 [Clostridiales bacterium]|nr:hypothetical protein [Clostridiales bacterium]
MGIFNKNAPACKYCLFSSNIENDEYLCKFRGVLKSEDNCKRFKYDPLKRVPKFQPKLEKYTEKDFSLE